MKGNMWANFYFQNMGKTKEDMLLKVWFQVEKIVIFWQHPNGGEEEETQWRDTNAVGEERNADCRERRCH